MAFLARNFQYFSTKRIPMAKENFQPSRQVFSQADLIVDAISSSGTVAENFSAKGSNTGQRCVVTNPINIECMRREFNYTQACLLEKDIQSSPFMQFDIWFKEVLNGVRTISGESDDVNAASLSTVGVDNRPSSRMILLKRYGDDGFTFFTHSTSRKGNDMERNPYASLLFYWPIVSRQVRIEGITRKLDSKFADEYWLKRPIGSRIGSKISEQSAIIPSRKFLEKKEKELEILFQKDGEKAISRPTGWLGYILVPDSFEFWQGQKYRIHDRIVYEKKGNNWIIKRLAP